MVIKPSKVEQGEAGGELPPMPTRGKLGKLGKKILNAQPTAEDVLSSGWPEDGGTPIRPASEVAIIDELPPRTMELRSVDSLIPFERNARKHSDQDVGLLAAWIKKIGWTNPILLDGKNGIVAGHRRLAAAQKLGLKEVQCIDLIGLTEIEKAAYIIWDNQSTIQGTWDLELLKLEVLNLEELSFDVTDLGFEDKFLIELTQPIPEAGLTDDDAVPAPPKVPVSKPGDVWTLDGHRLMCGDALNIDHVKKLMNGTLADLLLTDPPYGVSFERGKFVGRAKAAKGEAFAPIANDALNGQAMIDFVCEFMINAGIVMKDAAFYVWSAPLRQGAEGLEGIHKAGFKVQSQIIWNKTPFVIGRADFHWKHEIAWYGFKEGRGHSWYGGRDKSTVWDVPKPHKMENHPTQKPVELFEIAITNSTKGKDTVLDLFAGSGTTLIACAKHQRYAMLMELEPVYCDVAIKRFQEWSGKQAILEATGETYDQLKSLAEGVITSSI